MRINSRIVRTIFILLILVGAPRVLRADGASLAAVKLLVGRSMVIDVGTPIARVSLTSSDIADAMVTTGNQLLVNGKMPGTITMFVWERAGALRQYEIVVQRDLAILNDQMRRLFPGESIDAQSNGKSIVLSGVVSNKDLAEKAVNVAAGYVEKSADVVNLLTMQETAASNQVLLKVRFAEVSRSAMTELGVSLFTSPTGVKNTLGRTSTGQFAAPGFDSLSVTKADSSFGSDVTKAEGKFTFSDFLNLFLFSEKYDIGAMIKALQVRGMFQSLAEPNLVAESGKEASFLAGGEIPIPIAQGGTNNAISVQYKEFGIRLNFTPTVIGNRVHLKVKPEVSALDFANGVVLQGFRIPALSTRRTETDLELMDGQTFAIAGLMNNTVNNTIQKIPGIGDIPILGLLFKSKAAQKNQTELVVMITPQILARNSPGVTPTLPRTPEPFLPPTPEKKSFEAPAPSFTPQRSGDAAAAAAAAAKPVAKAAAAPVPASIASPAEAAATVAAIMRPKPLPVVVQGPTPAAPVAPAQPPASPGAQLGGAAQPLASTQTAGAAAMPTPTRDERKAAERQQKDEKKEQERMAKLARDAKKTQAPAAR
jgi:pilus assembly protein CpaC